MRIPWVRERFAFSIRGRRFSIVPGLYINM